MSDIGIGTHYPTPGIYGTANPDTDTDPYKRTKLQEDYFAQELAIKEELLGDA